MKKIFLSKLLFILLMLLCVPVSYSQVTRKLQPTNAEQTQLPLKEQANTIEKKLSQLQLIIDKSLDQSSIEALLRSLPVTTQTIDDRIAQLDMPEHLVATQTQIDELENKNETILKTKDSVISRLTQLTGGETELNEVEKAYLSLEQLLSNPVHKANITLETQKKISAFNQKINALKDQFGNQIEELSLLSRDLDAANIVLTRWQSALSAGLLKRQNTENHPVENNRIVTEKGSLQAEIAQLQKKLRQNANMDLQTMEQVQQSIYEKQTLIWLLGVDEKLLQLIERPTLDLSGDALETLPLVDLNKQQEAVLATQKSLNSLMGSIEAYYADFEKHTDIIGAQPILEEAFTQRMKAIAYQRLLLQDEPELLAEVINEKKQDALFSLDPLYTKLQFGVAFSGIADSLIQMGYQVQISFESLWRQILAKPVQTLVLAGLGVLVALVIVRYSMVWLKRSTRLSREDGTGLMVSLRKLSHALRKNSLLFFMMVFIAALVRASEIPYPSNHIIRTLVYVCIVTVLWLTLIRVESKLYRGLRQHLRASIAIALALALFVILYAIAYMSAVASPVLSLYEKGVMITLALFVWIERERLQLYFSQNTDDHVNKAYGMYLWLLRTLPIVIMVVCGISLIGFSRLAWQILGYVGVGLVYFIGLTLGLKLINKWRKKAKLYTLKRFDHGAFIASDIVSPISTVSKILWIWGGTAVLFNIMDWNRNSYLMLLFLRIVRYPIVTIGNTVINIEIITLVLLALFVIFRTARWLRTFSYHWLYARIGDLGIRGSLSIFTQYVAAVVGVLIALNVLGIDLTSLAVFAGALGVGVGLGLQDIAKNFISGILLLIERPLRNGDWVNIDGNEGTVKSIGMRAITMETFDKQEVIIPNGNAISNSFINNTHTDSVLRTVLYVGAGYDSDPNMVIDVLNNILKDTREVLNEPQPQIVLWEYADSSINYRIQYYVNIDSHGLYSTRTTVLKRVWHEFKANNIEIPFPQRDINLRSSVNLTNKNNEE